MKKVLFSLCLLFAVSASAHDAGVAKVSSPDGKNTVEVNLSGTLMFRALHADATLMDWSTIALEVQDGPVAGTVKGARKPVARVEATDAPLYRQNTVNVAYNEMEVRLNDGFSILFRAYDEGFAYRFKYGKKAPIIVKNERTSYRFTSDCKAWLPYTNGHPFDGSFECPYDVTTLSAAKAEPCVLPLTVDCGEAKVTVLESDLESYPGMFLVATAKDGEYGFEGLFAPYPKKMGYHTSRHMTHVVEAEDYIAKVDGARSFPWRVFAVTEKDTEMPVNNLVYALATPNRIGDTSWIKPGKVAWDWWNNWNLKGVDFKAGVNMDTYKFYIDFAAANGIEYIVLDEGWYNTASGDILDIVPAINLPELIAYGKQKGVDIVLWMVFNCVDENLDVICKTYSEMGAKGFKIDFLDRHDQTAVEMAYRIAAKAAEYHLFVDYHGFYKPTGLSRTYPNVVNYEGVYGLENMKWASRDTDQMKYDVTIPFIRMMAGPMDYTPGAMINRCQSDWYASNKYPMSQGTRCRQMALYVVYDSPFTMLCDVPTNYMREPECTSFIASVPTDPDETVIPAGEVGEYCVSARRFGNDWFVGGITSWTERDVTVDFSFLPEGKSYQATLFCDGVNANKNAEDYAVKTFTVSRASSATIHLASGGGFAMKLAAK